MLLPNNVNVDIRMNRTLNDFVLLSGDEDTKAKNFAIHILDATLIITRVKLAPEKQLAIEKEWLKKNVRIPLTRSKVYNKTVASGISTVSMQHILRGNIPKRVFIAMVKDEAFAGGKQEDPFFFQHNKLRETQLKIGNKLVPKEKLVLEFQSDATHHQRILEGWHQTMRTLGIAGANESINMSPDRWMKGFTIFGFDLSPDMSAGRNRSRMQQGQMDLTMQFDGALPDTTTVLTYTEFDEEIFISPRREVVYQPVHM